MVNINCAIIKILSLIHIFELEEASDELEDSLDGSLDGSDETELDGSLLGSEELDGSGWLELLTGGVQLEEGVWLELLELAEEPALEELVVPSAPDPSHPFAGGSWVSR